MPFPFCLKIGRLFRVPASLALLMLPVALFAQTHPRLFFDAADIPGLRAKIQNEPFLSMYQDLLALKDVQDDTQYGPSYAAVRNAFLYVLTGDTAYATASLGYVDQTLVLNDPGDTVPHWADDSYKSLGRAMLGKGVALSYDFCYDAWSQADRDRISLALKDNADSLMRSGGGGWPGNGATANNWHGVRSSGAILSFLACDEPGVDISDAYDMLRTHLRAKYGTGPDAHGWDVEGVGYVHYPWGSFIGAAGIVLERLASIDMIADAPGAGFALWALWPGAIPLPTYSNFLGRQTLGLLPDFSDSNPNFFGEGSHGLSFYYAPPGYLPGIKWMYDRLNGALGDQTWDNYRHGTIYSILYYPDTTPEQNPETVWGLNYEDERHGMVHFRDRYDNVNDLVTQFNAKQLKPSNTHSGADLNGFRIFGFGSAWTTGSGRTGRMGGQTTVFKSDPGSNKGDSTTGQLLSYFYQGDGGGFSDISGSSTGVNGHVRRLITDYSQESGQRGVWIISDRTDDGTLWRLNTPGMNTITTQPGGFTITAPNGNRMEGTILHPAGAVPTTGTFNRGSTFMFESTAYDDNNFVQFNGTDGNFLVVLTVIENGQSSPVITPLSGSGLDQVFTVNGETFALDGNGLLVSGWTGGVLAPYAGIDFPSTGQYFRAGDDLLIEARANDLDGTVAEVRFYNGETLLGTDTSPPFNHLWQSVPAGNPTQISVVAVDNDGNESIPTALSFRPVVPKDARSRIEAEEYDANNGFRNIGGKIGYLNRKGWTRYNAVDFGSFNPATVSVEGSVVNGGSCEFRLDSLTGPLVATISFSGSGPFTATVDSSVDVTGIRDLFFKHKSGGPGVANVDAFQFIGGTPPPDPPVLHTTMDGSNMMVHFDTVDGATYIVKTSTTLSGWSVVSTITGDGTGESVPIPMPGTPGTPVFVVVEIP